MEKNSEMKLMPFIGKKSIMFKGSEWYFLRFHGITTKVSVYVCRFARLSVNGSWKACKLFILGEIRESRDFLDFCTFLLQV